jgi:AcrR family transcriptional regulator
MAIDDGNGRDERGAAPVRKPAPTKGERTRGRIVEAAEVVFVRLGYLDTRVADIAAEAGVAHGSFYTYFSSKEEIFREVAERVVGEMYAALDGHLLGASAAQRISSANRRFFELYERHAGVIALIEQVATFNSDLLTLRRGLRNRFIERVERAIRRAWADGGEASAQPLDPHIAANALAGMVDNFCYWLFVFGEKFDMETALGTIDEVWFRTLGLDRPTDHAGSPNP